MQVLKSVTVERAGSVRALVKLEGVHKSPKGREWLPFVVRLYFYGAYPQMQTKALDDVSFSVKKGEFCVICGQSGCGKTTLLRLLKPQSAPHGEKKGEILFCPQSLDKCSDVDTAFKIGYVAQNPENQIVTDTVMHELAFTLENMGISRGPVCVPVPLPAACRCRWCWCRCMRLCCAPACIHDSLP